MTDLCPVCCDSVDTVVGTKHGTAVNQQKITTPCCYQELCQECAQTVIEHSYHNFVCGHCGGQSDLIASTVEEAIKSLQVVIQERFSTILATAEARWVQLQQYQTHLVELANYLSQNLSQVSQVTDSPQLNQQIQQYQTAYAKTIALSQAEQTCQQQRTGGSLKYLKALGHKIAQAATEPSLADLIQWNHSLSLVKAGFQALPAVPRYQPVRWLNQRLVLDDIQDQFLALSHNQPVRWLHFPGLCRKLLNRPYHLNYLKASLVQLTDQSYLICSAAERGFVLINLAGQIVYHRSDRLLAINATWLVTLVINKTVANQESCGYYSIVVESLAEVLTKVKPPAKFTINLTDANHRHYIPLARLQLAQSTGGTTGSTEPAYDLVICYQKRLDDDFEARWNDRQPVVTNWALFDARAEMQYKECLSSQLRITQMADNGVIISRGESVVDGEYANEYYYTNLDQGQLPQDDNWVRLFSNWRSLLADGSVVIGCCDCEIELLLPSQLASSQRVWWDRLGNEANTVLRRPDGSIIPVVTPSSLYEDYRQVLTINPYDGRLVKFQLGPDDITVDFY